MIKSVSDITPLRKAFYQVFASRSPFDPAGRDEFPVRALIYPTWGYYLEAEQFQALMGALGNCGEAEFYISMVEYEPENRVWNAGEDNHWLCLNPSFEEYMQLDLFIENGLYSVNGSWGLLLSHEDHALFVCRDELWQSFERNYPEWRKDYAEFVDYWKAVENRGVDVKWLHPFLAHLTKAPAVEPGI